MGKNKTKKNPSSSFDESDRNISSDEGFHSSVPPASLPSNLTFKEKQDLKRKEKRAKRKTKERCYLCHEIGHTRKDCPGKHVLNGSVKNSSKKSSDIRHKVTGGERAKHRAVRTKTSTWVVSDHVFVDCFGGVPTHGSEDELIGSTIEGLLQVQLPNDEVVRCAGVVFALTPPEFTAPCPLESSSTGLVKCYMAGVPPKQTNCYSESVHATLEAALSVPPNSRTPPLTSTFKQVKCWGPIGLDYSCHKVARHDCLDFETNRADQRKVLGLQLDAAVRLRCPVCLVLRPELRQDEQNYLMAERDLVKILVEHVGSDVDHAMYLHAFAGRPTLVVTLRSVFKNLYVGFSGLVTHSKNDHLREAAFEVPLDRLLLESDAPHASPRQVGLDQGRDAKSCSAHVPHVAEALATVKRISSVREVLRACTHNAAIFFGVQWQENPEETHDGEEQIEDGDREKQASQEEEDREQDIDFGAFGEGVKNSSKDDDLMEETDRTESFKGVVRPSKKERRRANKLAKKAQARSVVLENDEDASSSDEETNSVIQQVDDAILRDLLEQDFRYGSITETDEEMQLALALSASMAVSDRS